MVVYCLNQSQTSVYTTLFMSHSFPELPPRNRLFSAAPSGVPETEQFAQVPKCFQAGLSAEEFRAWQQIYQIAYARAAAESGSQAAFPPDVDLGYGI